MQILQPCSAHQQTPNRTPCSLSMLSLQGFPAGQAVQGHFSAGAGSRLLLINAANWFTGRAAPRFPVRGGQELPKRAVTLLMQRYALGTHGQFCAERGCMAHPGRTARWAHRGVLGTATSDALPAFPCSRCRLRLGGKGRGIISHGNFLPKTPFIFQPWSCLSSQCSREPGASPVWGEQRHWGATGALGRAGRLLGRPSQSMQVESPPPGDAGSEHPVPPAVDRTAFTERRRVSMPAPAVLVPAPVPSQPFFTQGKVVPAPTGRSAVRAAVSRSRQLRSLSCSGRERSPAAALHLIPSPLIRAQEQQ